MKNALENFLAKFPSLTAEEIEAIVAHTQVDSFPKGTVILREGEVATKCYFVLKGCVRQYQLVDGIEKTTSFFTEEQVVIAYSSYLNDLPSEAWWVCAEDCILLTGTREQEQQMYAQHPKLEFLLNIMMPADYSKTQAYLDSLVKFGPEDRYLNLLETRPELFSRVPLHQIASYIGVTPESLSRIRKRIVTKEK